MSTEKKDTNWVDKQCKETRFFTPNHIIEKVEKYFGGRIPLDAATEAFNPTRALNIFVKTLEPQETGLEGCVIPADNIKIDGTKQSWDLPFFVNPPYGKEIRPFCTKIFEETKKGLEGIALLPCGARFGTRYWQNEILTEYCKAICFVRGRVSFIRINGEKAKGNPYDSAIYGFNVDTDKFLDCFSDLGVVCLTEFKK